MRLSKVSRNLFTFDGANNIESDDSLIINRSLDASKFNQATGYNPPTWQNLIETMYQYQ